jgi:hypothetical protein
MVLHIRQVIESGPINVEYVINLIADILIDSFVNKAKKHISLVGSIPIPKGNK